MSFAYRLLEVATGSKIRALKDSITVKKQISDMPFSSLLVNLNCPLNIQILTLYTFFAFHLSRCSPAGTLNDIHVHGRHST